MNDESRFTIHEPRATSHEPHGTNMRGKTSSIFGLFAAGLAALFGKSPAKPTAEDLGRMEFKTSTQRLGIRFTEKIRDVFRFRWIKRF